MNALKLCDILEEKGKHISIKDIMSCGISEGRAIEMVIRFSQLSDEQIMKNVANVRSHYDN